MSTKATTAKTNAARLYLERANREAVCERHGKAAAAFVRAAELFEDAHRAKEAESAWKRACEHAEKRSWELGQRRKLTFHA